MNVQLHPEAETEFLDSIDFYERNEPGLGEAFAQEVFAAIRNIQRYPETWPVYRVVSEDA